MYAEGTTTTDGGWEGRKMKRGRKPSYKYVKSKIRLK